MTARATPLSARQRGTALVETIIVSPLLLFLILATAEITNAFVDHNTVSKSVRSAARYVASNSLLGTTGTVYLPDTLITETRNLIIYGNVAGSGTPRVRGLASADVQVVPLADNNIQVTASYLYTGLLGSTLPALGLGSDIDLGVTLQATVTMKAL